MNAGTNLFCRPVDSGSWRHVSPGFKHVSTSGTYDLHAINTDEKILHCREPCLGQWISLDHSNNIRFRQCDATANAVTERSVALCFFSPLSSDCQGGGGGRREREGGREREREGGKEGGRGREGGREGEGEREGGREGRREREGGRDTEL